MKRTLITIALMATCLLGAYAQKNKKNKDVLDIDSIRAVVMEMYFGDVTVASGDVQVKPILEGGKIESHDNKARGLAGTLGKIGRGVAIGGAALLGTNVGKAVDVMQKGHRIEQAADIADAVAGGSAGDFVFEGANSAAVIPLTNQEVTITIKVGENQTINPKDVFRVVRFTCSKKNRSVTFMDFDYSLIKSENIKNGGYLEFEAKKIGDDLYQLTLPAEEMTAGEYGVFPAAREGKLGAHFACTFSIK